MAKWIRSPATGPVVLILLAVITKMPEWTLILGGYFYLFLVFLRWQYNQSIIRWPVVSGTLISCSERKLLVGKCKYAFSPEIEYHYLWGNNSYQSDVISLNKDEIIVLETAFVDPKSFQKELLPEADPIWNMLWWRQMKAGDSIPVYINPKKPKESFLIKEENFDSNDFLQVINGSMLLMIGLMFLGFDT